MKKLLCILLMLMFTLPALAEGTPLAEGAEESPFAPYVLTSPEGVTLESAESAHTFVSGNTRVVAIVIPRVPDEDPAEAVVRMMAQFEPAAVLGESLSLKEGWVGVEAVTADKYGEGVDQWNVMVLGSTGDLLILSGYDLDGDEESVQALMDALLARLTVDGVGILQGE